MSIVSGEPLLSGLLTHAKSATDALPGFPVLAADGYEVGQFKVEQFSGSADVLNASDECAVGHEAVLDVLFDGLTSRRHGSTIVDGPTNVKRY